MRVSGYCFTNPTRPPKEEFVSSATRAARVVAAILLGSVMPMDFPSYAHPDSTKY